MEFILPRRPVHFDTYVLHKYDSTTGVAILRDPKENRGKVFIIEPFARSEFEKVLAAKKIPCSFTYVEEHGKNWAALLHVKPYENQKRKPPTS